jgi:hypothetical protein
MDPAGTVRPARNKSAEKIDGIVGLVMAVGRVMARPADDGNWEVRIVLRGGGGRVGRHPVVVRRGVEAPTPCQILLAGPNHDPEFVERWVDRFRQRQYPRWTQW